MGMDGCYILNVFCDVASGPDRKVKHSPYTGGAEYSGQSRAHCIDQATGDGWEIMVRVRCPGCVKRNQR